MRVIIRADGNREIAMGHIMRCLSIGDALREEKAEVVFVTAGAETEELIRNRGYENYVLHTSFRHMEEELSAFWQYVQKFPCSLILTDSYFVTVPYMKEIKKWAKTAYIDDMGKPVYPVDILINYNVYGDTLPYHIWYSQENLPLPKLLLGGNYAPLRREFHEREGDRARAGKPSEKTDKTGAEKFEKAEFKRKAEVRNVLITTGEETHSGCRKDCAAGCWKKSKEGFTGKYGIISFAGPSLWEKKSCGRLSAAVPILSYMKM